LKKFVTLGLVLVLMLSLTLPAAAAYANPVSTLAMTEKTEISPHWEQTQWVFRVNNGVLEQRLWSLTFGRWLTEWHRVPNS